MAPRKEGQDLEVTTVEAPLHAAENRNALLYAMTVYAFEVIPHATGVNTGL